jgi:hypothetical protein
MKQLTDLLSKVVQAAQENPKLVKVLTDVLGAVLSAKDPVEAGKRAALAAGAKAAFRAR